MNLFDGEKNLTERGATFVRRTDFERSGRRRMRVGRRRDIERRRAAIRTVALRAIAYEK
jgi:hypothetical protein